LTPRIRGSSKMCWCDDMKCGGGRWNVERS
jgi:hypothetical protein